MRTFFSNMQNHQHNFRAKRYPISTCTHYKSLLLCAPRVCVQSMTYAFACWYRLKVCVGFIMVLFFKNGVVRWVRSVFDLGYSNSAGSLAGCVISNFERAQRRAVVFCFFGRETLGMPVIKKVFFSCLKYFQGYRT